MLSGAFGASWVSAGLNVATEVNRGLVQALNSVGQNLWGSAIFSARLWPVDPCNKLRCPSGVQLDLASDVAFPTRLNVFVPPDVFIPVDPCRVVTQLQVGVEGEVAVYHDPDGAVDLIPADLSGIRPDIARCPALPSP